MNPTPMDIHPVVIIGAGPAGLAAAMQLRRQGIDPVVLEREQVGGLLLNANLVENYPGFVKGISGPDLVKLFKGQADRLGVKISMEEVLSAHYESDLFRIVTNVRELRARILIAASGTHPNKLSEDIVTVVGQDNVYYQVFPLIDQINKDFLIIGAGDAAFDYALNLSQRNRITILNRGINIKALPLLVERSQNISDINYFSETEISRIYRNESGRLVAESREKGLAFECDYVLAAIGRIPAFNFADPSIISGLDELLEDQRIFLIGDLQNGSFRQTTIAVADGIRAAMVIAQILEKG